MKYMLLVYSPENAWTKKEWTQHSGARVGTVEVRRVFELSGRPVE